MGDTRELDHPGTFQLNVLSAYMLEQSATSIGFIHVPTNSAIASGQIGQKSLPAGYAALTPSAFVGYSLFKNYILLGRIHACNSCGLVAGFLIRKARERK
jgi:hypothetical protein